MGYFSWRTTAAWIAFAMVNLKSSSASQGRIAYHLEGPSIVDQLSEQQIDLLEKLNRSHRAYLRRLEKVIVPDCWNVEEPGYSPLPESILELASHDKEILVYLPIQVFGAYEYSRLIRWGPISSGRAQYPTPDGIFYLNWRSRERASTDNPAWHMNWYFNFHNKRGLVFHEFSLPGRPASHACIRLLRRDAEWLYGWVEGWTLSSDGRDVLQPGTPVWVIGRYEFSGGPPWTNPDSWGKQVSLPQVLFGMPGG